MECKATIEGYTYDNGTFLSLVRAGAFVTQFAIESINFIHNLNNCIFDLVLECVISTSKDGDTILLLNKAIRESYTAKLNRIYQDMRPVNTSVNFMMYVEERDINEIKTMIFKIIRKTYNTSMDDINALVPILNSLGISADKNDEIIKILTADHPINEAYRAYNQRFLSDLQNLEYETAQKLPQIINLLLTAHSLYSTPDNQREIAELFQRFEHVRDPDLLPNERTEGIRRLICAMTACFSRNILINLDPNSEGVGFIFSPEMNVGVYKEAFIADFINWVIEVCEIHSIIHKTDEITKEELIENYTFEVSEQIVTENFVGFDYNLNLFVYWIFCLLRLSRLSSPEKEKNILAINDAINLATLSMQGAFRVLGEGLNCREILLNTFKKRFDF